MDNKRPILSIVIPCYNHGKYIDDCLGSIYGSIGFDEFEIILVNDGSTDSFTVEKLSSLSKPKLQILHQENKGLSEARNAGIASARGEYILNLDCDNMITPQFLNLGMKIFKEDASISVVYSDKIVFWDEVKKTKIDKVKEFDPLVLLLYNYIDSCAIFKKSLWVEVGGFDKNISTFQDWDFWLSCLEKEAVFYHVSKPLFFYRIVKDSMIATTNSNKHLKENEYILKKHASLFAKNWKSIGDSTRYVINNPFRHFLRSLLKKPFYINPGKR